LLSKFGCDVAYARPPLAPTDSGEGGRGNPTGGVENAIFSWQEIAECFWATDVFLGGKLHVHRRFFCSKRGFKSLPCLAKRFSSTEVKFRTCEYILNIYKWKEKACLE